MKHIATLLVAALVAACGTNGSRRAEIEARKAALAHKQDSALAATQQALATVDSLLVVVNSRHDALHQWVMDNATRLADNAPEVQELNALRARRDSLQAEWQTLGAKIKYIKRKKEQQPQ